MHARSRRILLAAVLILSWALAVPASAAPPPATLKVMSRNLYLGADLAPILAAGTQQELVAAATQVYAQVQATNFPERAQALAQEIAQSDPHVVGLQEVTLWRSQTPADFNPTPNATHVEYDFLQLLLDALAARGKHYAPRAQVTLTDGELPRLTATGLQDIRYTDRDVIIARTDLPASSFSVTGGASAVFQTVLTVPNPVAPVTLLRGWTSVETTLRGHSTRVVNTHLERFVGAIQEAQGAELLAGPLNTPGDVALVGDLNSAAGGVGAVPGESDTATHANMLAAGFRDAWTGMRGPGFTCCHAADLRNPAPTLTERIDYVLFRGTLSSSVAELVGEEPADRTPSGLWPSDHAGLWAVLQQR
jgi:endonuclease/exonuclease/phosphatase family metal-dependent hydrolase